jgi:CubicO group peptidase (beta-lactamase class C family)
LESKVKLFKKSFGLPSVVVGIARGGTEIYNAQGNIGPFRKADKDTVYRLASMSKSFISASVMILAERGKVVIDKPVTEFLPEFRLANEESTKKITVRDVLSHRSGLPRHDLTLFLRKGFTLEQMVGIVPYLETSWAVGERFHYQNHMYATLSLLVQKVSGMPWEEFVDKNIFKPVGMTRSYAKQGEYVKVDGNYARPRMRIHGVNLPAPSEDVTSTGGSGVLSASTADVIKWIKIHMDDGGGLFSKESSKELHGRQTPIKDNEFVPYKLPGVEDRHYGFGWFSEAYKGARLVHHGGSVGGFKPFMAFAEGQDLGIAIQINQGGSPAASALVYTLFDEILGLEKTDWIDFYKSLDSDLRARSQAHFKELIGTGELKSPPGDCLGIYENPAYGKMEIKGTPQSPTLVFADTYKMKLLPGNKDDYAAKVPGFAFSCRFRLEGGKVAAFEANVEEEAPHYISYEKKQDKA